jgi:cupin 2 domain-containing protein
MTIQLGNLFADVADVSAANIGEEAFSEILARPGLKIERIISQGQTTVVRRASGMIRRGTSG